MPAAACRARDHDVVTFDAVLPHRRRVKREVVKLTALADLLLEELRDLYSAERQLLDALRPMADAAVSPELRRLLDDHRTRTEQHAVRLDRLCARLGRTPGGRACQGMQGILQDMWTRVRNGGSSTIQDAALVGAALRIAHYEIAGYVVARQFADLLRDTESHRLLQDTLNEETDVEHDLRKLAEGWSLPIPPVASQGG